MTCVCPQRCRSWRTLWCSSTLSPCSASSTSSPSVWAGTSPRGSAGSTSTGSSRRPQARLGYSKTLWGHADRPAFAVFLLERACVCRVFVYHVNTTVVVDNGEKKWLWIVYKISFFLTWQVVTFLLEELKCRNAEFFGDLHLIRTGWIFLGLYIPNHRTFNKGFFTVIYRPLWLKLLFSVGYGNIGKHPMEWQWQWQTKWIHSWVVSVLAFSVWVSYGEEFSNPVSDVLM